MLGAGGVENHFNPLGRKTETIPVLVPYWPRLISIHSVARPRLYSSSLISDIIYFNPLGRKTETTRWPISKCITTAFQSTRSQDRDSAWQRIPVEEEISIHSVARPRQKVLLFICAYYHFNPLGRKTETCQGGIAFQ